LNYDFRDIEIAPLPAGMGAMHRRSVTEAEGLIQPDGSDFSGNIEHTEGVVH
jgi:hypothetical protein